MSEALERIKAILSQELPEIEVQTLMDGLAIASGKGAVAIAGDAAETAITTGSQNVVGDNNRVVIQQGIEPKELVEILRSILEKFSQLNSLIPSPPSSPRATLQQFPEASRFDLTQLIEKCLGELLGKRGLVGLAVPCGDKTFLKNFCDRLKHELGRSNIQLRSTLSLNPQVISVSKAVEAIKQYKKLLQTSDVICSVRVSVCDDSSSIIRDFWQNLRDAFQGDFKHRLIVVMVGSEDCIFPPDAISLHPPRFEKVHAFQWICDITRTLDWMELSEVWMEKMVDRCLSDVHTGYLDVCLVYEHLEYTLSILQSDPSLSAEAFLEQLD